MNERLSWVILTKTYHGKPVWVESDDPKLHDPELRAGTIATFGPYLMGSDGYDNIKDAFCIDPATGSIDIDDPSTWDIGGL